MDATTLRVVTLHVVTLMLHVVTLHVMTLHVVTLQVVTLQVTRALRTKSMARPKVQQTFQLLSSPPLRSPYSRRLSRASALVRSCKGRE